MPASSADLHGLADQAFGAGEIEAQPHMRIGQRLLQPRQGAGEGMASSELRRLQRFERRDMLAVGTGNEDDLGIVEEAGAAPSAARSRIASAPFGIGDEEMMLAGLRRQGSVDRPADDALRCHSSLCPPLAVDMPQPFALRLVFFGSSKGSGCAVALIGAALVADFELGALDGAVDVEPGDAHRFLDQRRIHGAGHHADLLAVAIDRRALVGRLLAVEQHAKDLEALLALEAVVLLGAAKAGLAGADGEVEAELPQRVARPFIVERILLANCRRGRTAGSFRRAACRAW